MNKNTSIFGYISLTIWPHRLTVRTPGFHPGNPSSILGEITKENRSFFMDGRFSFCDSYRRENRTRRCSIASLIPQRSGRIDWIYLSILGEITKINNPSADGLFILVLRRIELGCFCKAKTKSEFVVAKWSEKVFAMRRNIFLQAGEIAKGTFLARSFLAFKKLNLDIFCAAD